MTSAELNPWRRARAMMPTASARARSCSGVHSRATPGGAVGGPSRGEVPEPLGLAAGGGISLSRSSASAGRCRPDGRSFPNSAAAMGSAPGLVNRDGSGSGGGNSVAGGLADTDGGFPPNSTAGVSAVVIGGTPTWLAASGVGIRGKRVANKAVLSLAGVSEGVVAKAEAAMATQWPAGW